MEDMMLMMDGGKEQLGLINELIQGKELANQLYHHILSSSSSSSSLEAKGFLIDKILSTYHKALTMLNQEEPSNVTTMNPNNCGSTNGSPRSGVMDEELNHKPAFKKRKTMPRWTEQVKICSNTGFEGSLDDGYSWRKYGQKDILGAKFPRGYYRCTHRNVQGCLATKQVQRSDTDPTIIEVTYGGRHTCRQAKHITKAIPSQPKIGLEENPKKIEQPREGAIFTFEAKSEDLDTNINTTSEDIFPRFCYLSPSMGSENQDDDNSNMLLPETMMENHFMATFSPSESNLFCLSPLGSTGLVQTSESDNINEIVSATTSVTNSPILDLDMLLDKGDFDTDFPEYFSL